MTSTILSKITEQTRFLGNLSKNSNFWIILIIDALLIIAAHYLSYVIRFEGEIGDWEEKIINLLPIILTIKLPILYFCGLYRGMWRYTSMVDIFNIAFACVTSTIFIVFYLLNSESFHGYSRSVFLIDSILTFLFISINRTSMRFISHSNRKYFSNGVANDLPWIKGKKRILLIGAGDAGEKIIR